MWRYTLTGSCGPDLSVNSGTAHNPFTYLAFLLLKYSHILGSKNIRSTLKEASATDAVLKKVIQSRKKGYNKGAKKYRDRDRDRDRSASRSPRDRSRSRGRSRSRSPRRPSGKNHYRNYKSSGYKYHKGKSSGGGGGSRSYKKSKPDKSKD